MEELIEITINSKYDLIDKYNKNKLSNQLLKYIIKQAISIKNNKKIKIIINKKIQISENSVELLKEALKEEYNKSVEERNSNNVKQILLLLLGMIFIFISTKIQASLLWKEIILITGWVPIWEMVKIELFADVYGRRKRRTIKKLLTSEIIEKGIKYDI